MNNDNSKPILDLTNQVTSNYSHSTKFEFKENLEERHVVFCALCGKGIPAIESYQCPRCKKHICYAHMSNDMCDKCLDGERENKKRQEENKEQRRLADLRIKIRRLIQSIAYRQLLPKRIPFFIGMFLTAIGLFFLAVLLDENQYWLLDEEYIAPTGLLGVILIIAIFAWWIKLSEYPFNVDMFLSKIPEHKYDDLFEQLNKVKKEGLKTPIKRYVENHITSGL